MPNPPYYRLLAAALLFIFLTPAWSAPAGSGPLPSSGEMRFTPVARYLGWLKGEELTRKFREAGSVVRMTGPDGGSCTAAFISEQGHLLTARHCLQKCMIRAGLFRLVYEQGMVSYFVLNPEKLGQAGCKVKLNGEEADLVIESTSPGLLLSMDESGLSTINRKLYLRLVEEGYTSRGDFLIARKILEPGTSTPCMPLSLSPVRPGEAVHSFGYPSETHRPDGWNSDGEGFYATSGQVLPSIRENACVRTDPPQGYRLEDLIWRFDESTAFISTLDAIHGSSGSPVFNSKGEINGILTNVYRPEFAKPEEEPDVRYCSGSAKALKTERILEITSSQGRILPAVFCRGE